MFKNLKAQATSRLPQVYFCYHIFSLSNGDASSALPFNLFALSKSHATK